MNFSDLHDLPYDLQEKIMHIYYKEHVVPLIPEHKWILKYNWLRKHNTFFMNNHFEKEKQSFFDSFVVEPSLIVLCILLLIGILPLFAITTAGEWVLRKCFGWELRQNQLGNMHDNPFFY